jgi:hypothetical protein
LLSFSVRVPIYTLRGVWLIEPIRIWTSKRRRREKEAASSSIPFP